MNDELWMKKIKERLEDYSESPSPSGWDRLEKKLSPSVVPTPVKKKIIPAYRWAVTAAAVLLIAVSSVSLWLLSEYKGEELRNLQVPSVASVPDYLPEKDIPMEQPRVVEPAYKKEKRSTQTHSLVAQNRELPGKAIANEDFSEYKSKTELQPAEKKETVQEDTETTSSENVTTQRVERRPSSKDKLHLPVMHRATSDSKGWSVGLSVGNTGITGDLQGSDMDRNFLASNFPGMNSGRMDLAATSDGVVAIPADQKLVFRNGLPYLQSRESIHHKQPISFGLSIRKNLPKNFSIETGLTYTYLASDILFEGSSEEVSQKMHYVGIPLRANWNFVNQQAFTLYVSGGGTVEKCIYGKIGSKTETVKPIQLSVMGAVGAQYNVSRKFGLYVEPGISYFFDDGSAVQTIRKENPLNFTLQAGIRLTY